MSRLAHATLPSNPAPGVVLRVSEFQPTRKFKPEVDVTPYGWIQWKGTDVCMDFHCKCGAHGHIDADFTYFVKCGNCGQVYEMSGYVEAMPIDAVPSGSCDAVVTDVDEEVPVTSQPSNSPKE